MTEPQVPTGGTSTGAGEEPECSVEEYNQFVGQVEIAGIDTVVLHAERHRAGTSPVTQFSTGAGWLHEGPHAAYRFDVQAVPLGDDEQPVATIKVSLVVNLDHVPEDSSPQVLERFGANAVTMMAFPFLREAVATMAQRLNLPGVILPMIQQQPAGQDADVSTPTAAPTGDDEAPSEG